MVYDPEKISLVDILRWFWEAHDPTQGMGQGNDRGTQYRSGAYYFDDEQKALIEASKAAYEGALAAAGIAGPITTEVAAASEYDQLFYYGENYHQQYLAKPGAAAVLLGAAALRLAAGVRVVVPARPRAPRAEAARGLLGAARPEAALRDQQPGRADRVDGVGRYGLVIT